MPILNLKQAAGGESLEVAVARLLDLTEHPEIVRWVQFPSAVLLFGDRLAFVYDCFDRIVIHGYLSGLSRPEQVVYFFRQIVGRAVVSKEVLRQRTDHYQNWVEAFARNRDLPIEWAEKGVRKEDHVLPWLRRMSYPMLTMTRPTGPPLTRPSLPKGGEGRVNTGVSGPDARGPAGTGLSNSMHRVRSTPSGQPEGKGGKAGPSEACPLDLYVGDVALYCIH